MKQLMFAALAAVSVVSAAFGANADAADRSAAAWSKKCNMTVEAWKALSPAEQKAKKEAYRASMKDTDDKNWARWTKMSVEEWKALKPDEQKAKKDEVKAAKAKKQGK